MKKIIIFLTLLFCIQIKSQTIYVIDNTTRDAIENAVITDKNKAIVLSNAKGIANLSTLDVSGGVTIYHPSFNTVIITELLQTNEVKQIYLTSKSVVLDEVILSANKKEEKQIDVPYSINIIKQKDIEFANQPTSAEVLQNTGAVFIQKSQLGGGSPVLRGFEANKTLIVVDGVRMNNAIYRGGHLQDVITLDANMLERTEVMFGPASTIYGSDALGGVMHFYTKNAQFSTDDKMLVKTNAMVRYASVNAEKTGHLDFNLGWKKFASLTNITYSDFGDLISGSTKLTGSPNSWDRNYYASRYDAGNGIIRDTMTKNENNNLQKGSCYSQVDIMQRFNFKTGQNLTHNLNFQYSQSSKINRYDRLTDLSSSATATYNIDGKTIRRFSTAEWYYGPQKRLFAAYTLNFDKKTSFSDNIKFITAYQKIDQDRISRIYQKTALTSQREDVRVYSVNFDLFKRIASKHELRYGTEFTCNDVKSTADSTNILKGDVGKAKTRYGDGGNTMNTIGVYVSHAWEVNENFVITDGLRFTANNLQSKFNDTTFYKFPYTIASQKNNAVTGNIGFTWKENDNYKVSLLVNTGFRTPNIDDMSKVFDTKTTLVVPNPNLKPEYATNFEFGISKIIDKKYKFDVTTYATFLENAIVVADFKFNGADSALFNGGKLKTQAAQNKNRAYIYGLTAGMQFDFNENISFKGIVNYTYGRYADVAKDTILPLDHIPPVFGQTSLLVKQKSFDGEFFIRFNGKKSSIDYSPSGEDNKQYSADQINGMMPAWFTLNIRAGYNITKNFRVNASCENITDNRYRTFSSGINAPGRNFIVSLRYKM